jgi:hypothetical protein
MSIFRKFIGTKGSENDYSTGKICSTCGQSNLLEAKFCSSCGNEFKIVLDHFDAFISYRRETGSDLASLLKIQLENRFNKQIFLDVNELQVGRFDEELLRRIEETPNFIVILSRASLDRCANKSDWLKREIMQAIKTGRNIIPVMTENFSFPSDEIWALLPSEMRVLSTLNGVNYSHIHQDSAIRKIASYMKHETEIHRTNNNIDPKSPSFPAAKEESQKSDIRTDTISSDKDKRAIEPNKEIKTKQSASPAKSSNEKIPSEVTNKTAVPELGKIKLINTAENSDKNEHNPTKAHIGNITFISNHVENLNINEPHIGTIKFITNQTAK